MKNASSHSGDSDEIDAVIGVLRPYEEMPLLHLLGIIEAALLKQKKVSAPTKKSKKAGATKVNQDLILGYLVELEVSGSDGPAMTLLVKKMKADKALKAPEISGILTRIRGSDVKVGRKADGIKEIETWFQRLRDTKRRLGGVEELF